MKKLIASILALLLAAPIPVRAEGNMIYEAENAKLNGKNKIISDAEASSKKAVGNFERPGDTVDFTVEIPESGLYDLSLTCKGIGGGKINNVLIDGTEQGQFQCPGTEYYTDTLRGVLLSGGTHTVSITGSWGWILLDKLGITPAKAVSDDVYSVSPMLINPNATPEATALFRSLCASYGKYTLAGQVCDGGFHGTEFRAIHDVTGKYPAILGLDMMDYTPSRVALGTHSSAVEHAIEFHEIGGIITFCWHWNAPTEYLKSGKASNGNPRWWGGFYTENTNFDLAAVMNGKDSSGKEALDRDIAEIARQLLRLQEAGVPVLWRPLHEASGGWFWWGAKGAEACSALWVYLYDQLTNTYGCNNLIWVWNGQNPDWYPGDEYVDIIGTDIYAAKHTYNPQNSAFSALLDYSPTNKIIALTENGVVFDIDQSLQTNARWAWFNTWCGDFVIKNGKYSSEYTEEDILKKAYNSESVITMDELPNWYIAD